MNKNILKSALVWTGLDKLIADVYTTYNWKMLEKLIPYRHYYTEGMHKKVHRRGALFIVYPYDYSQWIIFANSDFGHTDAFEKFFQKKEAEGLVLDVGANMGQFSLSVGKVLIASKSPKKIISFEANPSVYTKYKQNLSLNPTLADIITVHNVGIGEKEGVLEIQVPLRNSGAGSLVRKYEHEPHEKHSVKLVSLDYFLKDSTIPVDYIKIDVENYEYMVLQGAEATISKWKPTVYIEMGKGQINPEGIMRFFTKKGYQIYLDNEDGTYAPVKNIEDVLTINKLYNLVIVYPQ